MSRNGVPAKPDWPTLNAFVDGELPRTEAARIASALRRDPELAAEVTELRRLKTDLRDLAPRARTAVDDGRATRPRWVAAAAAVLLCLLLLGGDGRHGEYRMPFDTALATHHAWAASGEQPGRAGAAAWPASAWTGRVYLPDLDAARLTLVHVASVPIGPGPDALHLGYAGTRGCRVSLIAAEGAGRDGPQRIRWGLRGTTRIAAWNSGGIDYLLLATGMDEHRWRVLATAVADGARRHAPPDEDTRIALARSRDDSIPCAG